GAAGSLPPADRRTGNAVAGGPRSPGAAAGRTGGATMTLWIDADACPRPVRDIMLRAAKRRQLQLVLVANSSLGLPPAPGVRQVVVPGGADVADLYIIEHAEPNDLVVTADIPLADGLVRRNITAIN